MLELNWAHVHAKHMGGELIALRGTVDFLLGCLDDLCKPLHGKDVERIFSLSVKFNLICEVPVMNNFYVWLWGKGEAGVQVELNLWWL